MTQASTNSTLHSGRSAPADPSATGWCQVGDRIHITPWIDPVVDRRGHDPRSTYVERFWLGTLGPTATWLLRRVAAGFDDDPAGYDLDLASTAQSIGLSFTRGQSSPFAKAFGRCVMFGLAHVRSDGYAIRRRIRRSPAGTSSGCPTSCRSSTSAGSARRRTSTRCTAAARSPRRCSMRATTPSSSSRSSSRSASRPRPRPRSSRSCAPRPDGDSMTIRDTLGGVRQAVSVRLDDDSSADSGRSKSRAVAIRTRSGVGARRTASCPGRGGSRPLGGRRARSRRDDRRSLRDDHGDLYRFKLPKGIGHEQHGDRFGSSSSPMRCCLVQSCSSRQRLVRAVAASWRPEIGVDGVRTRYSSNRSARSRNPPRFLCRTPRTEQESRPTRVSFTVLGLRR